MSTSLWSVARLATPPVPTSRQGFPPWAFHIDLPPSLFQPLWLSPSALLISLCKITSRKKPRLWYAFLSLGLEVGTWEFLPSFQHHQWTLCAGAKHYTSCYGGKYIRKRKNIFVFRSLPNNRKVERNTCKKLSWHILHLLHLLLWGI